MCIRDRSSLPGCGFSHQKYYDGIREPLGFATGRFCLFVHKLDKLTGEYGQNMDGSGKSFCSSLYAIIVCGILEKAAANASSY